MEKKINYKDMLLESESGYMMPFPLGENEELQTTLGYGKQRNPMTGQDFIHNGVDFAAKDKPLYAIASGVVVGMGQEAIHGNYIVAKYGKYEVTYGHIAEAYTSYGTQIKAGQQIAQSGDFLHVGVRFNGEELDPMEFLSMIWANIQQLAAMGIKNQPTSEKLGDKTIKTAFDNDQNEILMMMMRWLPNYMNDLHNATYVPPQRFETSLRNIFTQAAAKNYFFEKIPNVGNPLGLTERSAPLAEKIQNLLIEDFLGYMVSHHSIYPSNWDEQQKKNFLTKLPVTD